jgi:redox-sensitive bicupin YhaK (pirin superfamily)
LKANYSFSFARWFDPNRMGFGALRVLNDDIIDAGRGFGRHPHDNMEIITIPLEGALRHQDSTGGQGVIRAGEVQMMSAGTGIEHSEMNASPTEAAKTLQIWVFPNVQNAQPRYAQRSFDAAGRVNQWQVLANPDGKGDGLPLRQDAWFKRGIFNKGKVLQLKAEMPGSGLYLFVIEGKVKAGNQLVGTRDALGIYGQQGPSLEVLEDSDLLVIEVPLEPFETAYRG